MIIDDLKKKHILLRKEKSDIAASVGADIAEIEMVGKNNGNRQTTDDEAVAAIKKIVSKIEESLIHSNDRDLLEREIVFFDEYMPTMASEEELEDFINSLDSGVNIGYIMGKVKQKFGQSADMKMASKIAATR